MTTDNFTKAARAEAERVARENTPLEYGSIWEAFVDAYVAGLQARARLAAQEPTDAAQIIDQHRQDGRSVGYGVTVHCACGAESWGYIDGSQPIDGENNSHREADRKHAAHVAEALSARAARRDEGTR